MATPAQIITNVAALQNDAPQDVYTNAAVLPYLNMAIRDLQEEFELNDIPVAFDVSTSLNVSAGVSVIGFSTTPALPSDLIEIKQLWESPENLNQWTPMVRKDFIPHYLENGTTISQFLVWAWVEQQIKLIPSNADNDLKLDYLKSLLPVQTIGTINTDLAVINSQSYLEFKTASYCSYYIGENEARAASLSAVAERNLIRALGINVKGRQSVRTRRMPFRASFKSRNWK